MIKICEHCGKEFETDRNTKRFCTRKCKEANKQKRRRKGIRNDNIEYTRVCPVCGIEFTTNHSDKIYCSDDCAKEYKKEHYKKNKEYYKEKNKQWYENNKKYHKEWRENNKKEYVCLTCGKTFQSTNHKLKHPYCNECIESNNFKHICTKCGVEFISNKKNVYMCDKCKEDSKRERKESRKVYITKVCTICGKEFVTSNSRAVYCSDECRRINVNIKAKEYRDNPLTRPKYKKAKIKCREKRLKTDIDYKLKSNIQNTILKYLKKYGKQGKSLHTLEYLDYTMQDLKKHLESQFKPDMNWSNHGTLWHIDHIRPMASFKFVKDGKEDIEAVKQCWSLDNLKPLYKKDNLSKGSAYNGMYYKNGEPYKKVKV